MVGPRKALSGRFAFQGFLKSQREVARWVAVEADTGRRVVAVVVDPGELPNLERAGGVVHRHLPGLVEGVREVDPEGAMTVIIPRPERRAEYGRGRAAPGPAG